MKIIGNGEIVFDKMMQGLKELENRGAYRILQSKILITKLVKEINQIGMLKQEEKSAKEQIEEQIREEEREKKQGWQTQVEGLKKIIEAFDFIEPVGEANLAQIEAEILEAEEEQEGNPIDPQEIIGALG